MRAGYMILNLHNNIDQKTNKQYPSKKTVYIKLSGFSFLYHIVYFLEVLHFHKPDIIVTPQKIQRNK